MANFRHELSNPNTYVTTRYRHNAVVEPKTFIKIALNSVTLFSLNKYDADTDGAYVVQAEMVSPKTPGVVIAIGDLVEIDPATNMIIKAAGASAHGRAKEVAAATDVSVSWLFNGIRAFT